MKLGNTKEKLINEDCSNIITFGKYKGTKISELTVDYLVWLKENIKDKTPEFENAIEDALEDKKDDMLCFRISYTPTSKMCARCPFIEECAALTNYIE
jgi:hypothetical protein